MHHTPGLADTFATDLIGPLPRSTAAHTWLSVCQDTFTRLVELRPIRKATATAITQHIAEVIYRHSRLPMTNYHRQRQAISQPGFLRSTTTNGDPPSVDSSLFASVQSRRKSQSDTEDDNFPVCKGKPPEVGSVPKRTRLRFEYRHLGEHAIRLPT